MFATGVQRWLYRHVAKPIFFLRDPEVVHDRALWIGRLVGAHSASRSVLRFLEAYQDPLLKQTILGIDFENPVGLAAGFDKNAQLTETLPSVGFGFVEVGSITGEPCAGNPKPRLWRHPDLRSLRVYFGLKNDGAAVIARRLRGQRFAVPVGISMAKTNCQTTVEQGAAIADYVKVYEAFEGVGAYDTINISCPNAYGGQPFTDPDRLDALLQALSERRNNKPMFLKLSPDLSLEQLDAIAHVAKRRGVNGLIVSNLLKDHQLGEGGLSGRSVVDAALTHLMYLAKNYKDDFILVSCGGVFSAWDAYNRIRHGAHLVQLITGMVYEGPQLIGEINKELADYLRRDGYTSIADAVGSAYRIT